MRGDYERHKIHRNFLYVIVVILLILQLISFVVISSMVTKIHNEVEQTKTNLYKSVEFIENKLDENNKIYYEQFSQISNSLISQQESFEEQIKLLKASYRDFSAIVEDSVKSIVSIATDRSMGSGFVVGHEGDISYIVTNYHVIYEAEKIRAVMHDKKIVSASVVGIDLKKDIALLSIYGDYKPLTFANSDNVQVGSKVIAIGNPFGLSFSVTEGIVSAKKRVGPTGVAEYIQTDVSLNPGNSGGPLINTDGKVVGINNFKVGNAESLGFALESNSVVSSINKISNKTLVIIE